MKCLLNNPEIINIFIYMLEDVKYAKIYSHKHPSSSRHHKYKNIDHV